MDVLLNVLSNYQHLTGDVVYQRINQGYVAESWLVSIGTCRYVLKQIPKTTRCERVGFIAETQDHVSRNFHLSPGICRTTKDDLFYSDSSGFYILSEHVAGKHLSNRDLDPDTCKRVGAFLGRLHQCLQGFDSHCGSSKQFVLPRQPREKIESLLKYHQDTTKDRLCQEALRYKQSELKRLDQRLFRFESLPVQVIHGDFYLNNLLFDEMNDPVSVVDYDQACKFFRAYELMRGMITTIFRDDVCKENKVPAAHLNAFFRGYTEVVDLSPAEVDALTDLYYWILLCDTTCFEPSCSPRFDFTQMRDFGEYRMAVLRMVGERRREIQALLLTNYSRSADINGR
jgi:Ser/Thr protein kinase RdoA (MazF antagonist)